MEWIPATLQIINFTSQAGKLTRDPRLINHATVMLGYAELLQLEPDSSHYRAKLHESLTDLKSACRHLPFSLATRIEEVASQI